MGASNTKSKRKVSACPYDVGRHMITYKQWHKKYVRNDPGSDLLYVNYNAGGESHPKDAVTVSEAIGYGMLCSAMTGHRQDFDKFLGFYEKHLNKNGLMCWQQVLREGKVFTNPDDDANGTGNATDGDLDAAYALFLAAREWKEAAYKKRGIEICAALWEWNFNHDTFITHLGDWCKKGLNERADKYWWVSRPSDYMLAHFALFAQEDTERAATWTRVLDTSIQTLVQLQELHPDTGLVPDFVVYSLERQRYEPSVGRILEKEQDGCYFWNACRVPWRLAVYYHHSKDVRVVPLLQKLQTFFEQQPIIHAGYELDGKPLADYSHIAFMAPVWCLFTVMGSNRRQWLEDKIRENRAGGHGNYYGESMEIICVLELQQQPLLVSPESSTVALTPVS